MIDWLRFIVCGIFFLIAMITDIKTGKIKNIHIIVFLAIGLLINILTLNAKVIMTSILAMLIPLLLLPLFAVRMIGAGDIKALCTAGMIMGMRYGVLMMAYSFVGAGVIAVILMLFRGNFKERFKRFGTYMKLSILSGRFKKYETFDGSKKFFLFTYGLMSGWIITFVLYLLS